MRIELIHVTDCPNAALARERLDIALGQAGITATVLEIEVHSAEEAERLAMSGSPTILVNGVDPFGGAGPSLTCRLYRNGDVVEGAPPIDDIREALAGGR